MMKRVKSIIGIIMVAAMIAVMAAFSASAAPMALNVAVNAGKVEVGQEVIATASVDGFPAEGLYTFTVKITYDATALKLTKVEPVNYGAMVTVEPDEALNANGVVAINWISGEIDKAITGVNDVAVLTFEALSEDAGAAISAAFPANSMLTLDEALKLENGEIPSYVQPGDDTYSDAVVPAPPVEIVPEGSLDEEEPGESEAGSAFVSANGQTEIKVNGKYEFNNLADAYRVEIVWKDLNFTFTVGEKWDAADHTYKPTGEGVWSAAIEDAVAITNHSSQGVTIKAAAAAADGLDVVFDIDTEEKALTKWNAEGVTNAVAYDLAVTDGTLAQNFDERIGTVTITVGGIA